MKEFLSILNIGQRCNSMKEAFVYSLTASLVYLSRLGDGYISIEKWSRLMSSNTSHILSKDALKPTLIIELEWLFKQVSSIIK